MCLCGYTENRDKHEISFQLFKARNYVNGYSDYDMQSTIYITMYVNIKFKLISIIANVNLQEWRYGQIIYVVAVICPGKYCHCYTHNSGSG